MYVFNENMKFDWDICNIATCSFDLLFILLISATYTVLLRPSVHITHRMGCELNLFRTLSCITVGCEHPFNRKTNNRLKNRFLLKIFFLCHMQHVIHGNNNLILFPGLQPTIRPHILLLSVATPQNGHLLNYCGIYCSLQAWGNALPGSRRRCFCVWYSAIR